MQRITLQRAFRKAWLALAFAVTLLLLSLAPHSSFVSQAQATELQLCSAPQQSCGCNSCGGGDFGIPHCPSGYSPYDDYCLPDCPADFVRYPGMPGMCMPPSHHGCMPGYDQVPLASCPEGTYRDLRNPDQCLPDADYNTHLGACPQGMAWSYDHGRCEADCPQGTYRDGHGLCQSNYAQECPKDFVRDPASGRCVPPGIWPPNYTWVCLPICPPGTFRDIRHPTLCLPPPPVCEQGYENVDGRCLPICDRDARRDPYGNCIVPCPQGSYLNLRGQCQSPECPQGTRRNDRGQCLPPTHICDQGQESFDGKCVPICRDGLSRSENGECVPDRPVCPQGQHFNADTNACDSNRPNLPVCPPGQAFSPSAKICRDLPPAVHCDQGQYKNSDGRCVDIPQPPPQLQPICPQGTRPDGQGGCVRISVPTNCPQGTVLDRRTNSCLPLRGVPNLPNNQGGNLAPLAPSNAPPRIMVPANPALLQQIPPRAVINPGINMQQPCPDGSARDNNGRCSGPIIK